MAPIPVEALEVIKGSELPEVTDPSGMTFLGYKTTVSPSDTVRISLENMTPLFGVTQALGQSLLLVPSQKLITDELLKKADKINIAGASVIYSDDERLLKKIDYTETLLPVITDTDKKVLFGWDQTYNIPVIPGLLRSLSKQIDYETLAPDLVAKFAQLDSLLNTLKFVTNDDWILAATDQANKVIWGIDRDRKMWLFGQEISKNDYYGFTIESDEDWIIRYTDKENKVLWGIDRNFKVFPTDNRITELGEKVEILQTAIDSIENQPGGTGDSSIILDVNYKGFHQSLADLQSKWTVASMVYVNPLDTFRPSLVDLQKTTIGNSDQRLWYANVSGYLAYVRWNGAAYAWYLSDASFIANSTLGMKIALNFNSASLNLIDELKKAYLTNSITARTNTEGVIEFEPDLVLIANAGYYEYKNGTTKATYLTTLEADLQVYISKLPFSTIAVYTAPNIDIGYQAWIPDIEAKCSSHSIRFVNLNNHSGINPNNKGLFLLDANTLNQIGSKRISHRSLSTGNETERIGFSNKQSIPIIYINTENGEFFDNKPKDTKMLMTRFDVDVRDSGLKGFKGTLVPDKDEIRGRGNSTWVLEKKPYRLKFDKKVGFFGYTPEKNWVLLAVHVDKTSIRPSFCHRLGYSINDYRLKNGEESMYTPTEQLVEIVLNGRYDGLYCFTDHVSKVTTSRVNIIEPTPDDIATLNVTLGHYELKPDISLNVTGGFLLELETDPRAIAEKGAPIVDSNNIVTGSTGDVFIHPEYGDKKRYFACKTLEFYKKDFVTPSAENGIVLQSYMNYIENHISEVNTVLKSSIGTIGGKTYKQRIEEYIDLNTFIDYYFLQEVAKNPDGIDFSSIYYSKDRDKLVEGVVVRSKLKAGPIWDVDLAFGNYSGTAGQYPTGWFIRSNVWIYSLLRDPNIKQAFVDRWHALNLTSIWSEIMDELTTKSYNAAQRNNERWSDVFNSYFKKTVSFCPTNSINYELQLAYLRQWTHERIMWINNNINTL